MRKIISIITVFLYTKSNKVYKSQHDSGSVLFLSFLNSNFDNAKFSTNWSICNEKKRTNEMDQMFPLSFQLSSVFSFFFFLSFWCRTFYSGHTVNVAVFFRCWCAHQHGNRNVIKNLSWCLLLLSQFFHPFYRFS